MYFSRIKQEAVCLSSNNFIVVVWIDNNYKVDLWLLIPRTVIVLQSLLCNSTGSDCPFHNFTMKGNCVRNMKELAMSMSAQRRTNCDVL